MFARNEEINQWLDKNPLVLGGAALVLAIPFFALGVMALVKGQATAKWGKKLKGSNAYAMGAIWLVAGVAIAGFGIFKVVSGLGK